MRRANITGPKRAELVDAVVPKPKEDWALVKVLTTPMCTEYKAFASGHRVEFMGHEAAGEVAEVAQPCGVKPGDRVVVMPQYPCGRCALCLAGEYIHCEHCIDFGAFIGSSEGSSTYAQYLLKPAMLLPKIPDEISTDRASLACCGLGPTFGAFNAMNLNRFDTVLITGLGPVGLGAVVNACYRGARVIAVEPNEWRANRAKEIGAQFVLDPRDPECPAQIRDITKGAGVDKSVDCSGTPAGHRLCIDAARRKGQVAFVGACSGETSLRISDDMLRKGLTLHGIWHYNLARIPDMFKMIGETGSMLDKLVSHIFPLSQIQEAFVTSSSQESAKILLHPWE